MKHAQKDKSIIHIELTDISMKLPQLLTDIKIISVCIAIVKIFYIKICKLAKLTYTWTHF